MPLARLSATLTLVFVVQTACADNVPVDYNQQIKPLLARRCAECHGAEKQQVGLRVDFGKGLLEGGDSGPAIMPGKSAESLLIHAVTGTNGASRMPPKGDPLSEVEISLLRRWIDEGAQFPADEIVKAAVAKSSDHWAFQPIRRLTPPAAGLDRALNGIDVFISARLLEEGLSPSPEADRGTLARRVHLDLLGVPPTMELMHDYLADDAPDAFERLIDRLLASPHYGERWARDWLDAARYADSNGFTRDQPRSIWKYRDWLITAFNENLPFDQFTIEQLAGDLLPNPSLRQLVATGFHRNTLINEEGGTDPEQFRVEAVVDRTNTTGSVFLGLTIGCAQCHDHKYDPISQREYYQLYAFFNSTEFHAGDPAAPRIDVPSDEQILRHEPERKSTIRATIAALEQQLKDQAPQIAADLTEWEKSLTDDDRKTLPFNVKNAVDLPVVDRSEVHKRDLDAYFRGLKVAREKYPQLDEIARLRESEPKFPNTMITRELSEPRSTFVQIRGDFLRPGAKVEPAIPGVLTSTTNGSAANGTPPALKNRLGLATWLMSAENPLTARVIANRYWQRFFGRAIVETENDFGTQGDAPTHPELLDWLATELRGPSGIGETHKPQWDLKRFHRLVVTSATYRQTSHTRNDLLERDPLNKLLARQARLRVDAEMIRDIALRVSGLLSEELGGAPVYPPQPEGVFDFTQDKKPWKTSTGADRFRKAIYTQLWRSSLYPAMAVFDFPEPNVTCTRRIRSNTPLQSLTLANDQTFFEFAQGFAVRLLKQTQLDDSQKLTAAFEWSLSRVPSSSELARMRRFLHEQRERFIADPDAAARFAPKDMPENVTPVEGAAWTAVARVFLNLDEFITRE